MAWKPRHFPKRRGCRKLNQFGPGHQPAGPLPQHVVGNAKSKQVFLSSENTQKTVSRKKSDCKRSAMVKAREDISSGSDGPITTFRRQAAFSTSSIWYPTCYSFSFLKKTKFTHRPIWYQTSPRQNAILDWSPLLGPKWRSRIVTDW